MTEQTKQNIHPMIASMYNFVNEALTMEELEARLSLMRNAVNGISRDLELMKNPPTEEVVEDSTEARRARVMEGAESAEVIS